MLNYILQRLLRMVPQLFLISILAFVVIQLPPGDMLEERLNALRASGRQVDQEEIDRLTRLYGLDKPYHIRYVRWITNIVTRFEWGYSWTWNKPVEDVIMSRMGLTFAITFSTAIFVYLLALPIGIFVSVRQYTIADYVFTFLGFIGLAVPGFLLAIVLMYFAYSRFGIRVGGLFSPDYQLEAWSWAKLLDLAQHIWVPMLILSIGGTAGIIRTMRAMMLDELRKQYVTVARAKGLSELVVLLKYPVRIAINPMISGIGGWLPYFFSGGMIIEIVLNLPTAGPALYSSLMGQDMDLAGAYVMIMGALTAIGNLLSDVLLGVTDPRIRFGSVEGL